MILRLVRSTLATDRPMIPSCRREEDGGFSERGRSFRTLLRRTHSTCSGATSVRAAPRDKIPGEERVPVRAVRDRFSIASSRNRQQSLAALLPVREADVAEASGRSGRPKSSRGSANVCRSIGTHQGFAFSGRHGSDRNRADNPAGR